MSNISTEVLYGTWVSVSEEEIDPQAVFTFNVDILLIEIKSSVFQPDIVFYDRADGGDDMKIIKVLETELCRELPRTGDVILVDEENHRVSAMFIFQSLAELG